VAERFVLRCGEAWLASRAARATEALQRRLSAEGSLLGPVAISVAGESPLQNIGGHSEISEALISGECYARSSPSMGVKLTWLLRAPKSVSDHLRHRAEHHLAPARYHFPLADRPQSVSLQPLSRGVTCKGASSSRLSAARLRG
jgi:hypothetical protein